MKNLIKRIRDAYKKACIVYGFFYKNINEDVNYKRVIFFFRSYFNDNDLNEGIWQLHHIDVKTKNDITITITLGRPGLLIGKSGKTIDEITNELSNWLEKPVKIKINEYNVLYK